MSRILLLMCLLLGARPTCSAASFDLQEALRVAEPGATIVVPPGIHSGLLVVDRPIILVGQEGAVLQGGGDGDVVRIEAADVTIRGFTIRGTGISLDRENAAVTVLAPRATIEDTVIEDSLFGIYLKAAPDSAIRRNVITGKDLSLPRRGDGIRIWESSGTVIEDNTVYDSRDVVVWFSDGVRLRRNHVSGGRYGMHFMYCDDNLLEDNRLEHNSVGAFLMYSTGLVLRRNICARNRGPSGYGIGLKDMDDVRAEGNILVGNRVGINLDNSPSSIDRTGRFVGNVIAYNDHGIAFMPAVQRNSFAENMFLDNLNQIAILGGGRLTGNSFSIDQRGNFWSDYKGLDTDSDGIGNMAYTPMTLFGDLMDRQPRLRLFLFSPAQQALDFAARAMPAVRPRPKITDPAPLAQPPVIPTIAAASSDPLRVVLLVTALCIFPALTLAAAFARPRNGSASRAPIVRQDAPPADSADPLIEIRGLSKRYGRVRALDDITFSVRQGQSIALCGPNGAGKTTVLRCILGLVSWRGGIRVAGRAARNDSKAVKRLIGYVSQEQAFDDDQSVARTIRFFRALRRAPPSREREVLDLVDLRGHESKRIGALSGGMKQRLALAIALLSDPPILVLDEPTSNLDVDARASFLTLLSELHASGKTILFTSHRQEEVAALAEHVVLLEDGQIQRICTPEHSPHESQDRQSVHLTISADSVGEALQILEGAGVRAQRIGRMMIRAEVGRQNRLAPILSLASAGIRIDAFGLHDRNGIANGYKEASSG